MKRDIPPREWYAHFSPVQSVWGDMDALGHVNNVLYFRYAETARLDYMQKMGTQVPGLDKRMWQDDGMILAEITCRFLQQLRAPADLMLGTRVARMGDKTLFFETSMYLGDATQPVAVVDAVIVWFNFQTQKAISIPQEVRDAVMKIEVRAPEQV